MPEHIEIDPTPEPDARLHIGSGSSAWGPGVNNKPQSDIPGAPAHLMDYVKVLYKRRWTATTVFLLVVVSVTVYTFTTIPIFEARTRLLIEAENQNIISFKQVIEQDQTKADYYQTQYNILQSRSLARRTLEQLHLWNVPPFGGTPEKRFSLTSAILSAPGAVKRAFSKTAAQDTTPVPRADETMAQSRSIDKFIGHLTVVPIRNSRLVDIKYQLPDGETATQIINALATNYIEQNLEYKFLASKEATDWLGERLAEQRKQVEVAEAKLQRYREQNDAISLVDRENIVVQKLADLNAAVTRAKTERIQKQSLYQQLEQSQRNPAMLDTFPAILANPYIQTLKAELAEAQRQQTQLAEKLGDKHPQMATVRTAIQISQSKLNGEIAKVVQSVKSEYLSAQAQENSLSEALAQQKGEALSMNRKAIEYGVLDRDVESSRQLYQNLMQRAKETGVAGELKTSNIRIVDAAERPRAPIVPQTSTNLTAGVAGGLLLGCLLAFLFEYLDSRIKTPSEIRAHLSLPHLGLLPAVNHKGDGYHLINDGVPAHFAEAFRVLRTNLLFSAAQEGSRSLLVTSTGPGEGKTMIATNIAIGLAQAGQRVLIIDADMRRPQIHSIFKRPQEPGLSNLLVGQAKGTDVVLKTSVPGLWALTSGRIPPNPTELLGSKRFKDFLIALRQHFDWIIVDSPPVLAVADSSVIAHLIDGVLFVVGSEMTSRHTARTAVDQLSGVEARFAGAVLNRVDLDRHAYYYSEYYRREYATYYQKT